MKTEMIGAENIENLSGASLARDFGLISPKISTIIVMTIVEIIAPLLP